MSTEQLEYDHTIFEGDGVAAADKNLLVKFYEKSVINHQASREARAPKFEEKVYISIIVPGSREQVARPVTRRDKARFPLHWSRYEARQEAPTEGHPLKEWSLMSKSMAEELTFKNIKTVQQLANVNDQACQEFMGGHNLRAQAQEWLKQQEDDVSKSKLTHELSKRDEQISALQEQVEALVAQSAHAAKDTDKQKKRKDF